MRPDILALADPVPRGRTGKGHPVSHDTIHDALRDLFEHHHDDGSHNDVEGTSFLRAVEPSAGDNASAINAAIAEVATNGWGVVLLLPGVHNLSGTVDAMMTYRSGVRVWGCGESTIVRKRNAGAAFELTGMNHEIADMRIEGSADVVTLTDVTTTSGSNIISSASAEWDAADHVGAYVVIGGGAYLITHVAGDNAWLTSDVPTSGTNRTITVEAFGATSGVWARGRLAATPTVSPMRQFSLRNLHVVGAFEGVRFGQYSTLYRAGDGIDPDISGGVYSNVWLERCGWGWIEDGQNIINNSIHGLWMNSIAYSEVFTPRGGQVHINTGYLGPTIAQPRTTITSGSSGVSLPTSTINVADADLFPPYGTVTVTTASGPQQVTYKTNTGTTLGGCEGGVGAMSTGGAVVSNGWPKCFPADSNLILEDVRSENHPGIEAPAVVTKPGTSTAHVSARDCYFTSNAGPETFDVVMFGGGLTMNECETAGKLAVATADLSGANNTIPGGVSLLSGAVARSMLFHHRTAVGSSGTWIASNALGRLGLGHDPPVIAAWAVTLGSKTSDLDAAIAGPVAPQIGFFLPDGIQRAGIYAFGTGTNGGLLGFKTKPDGGAIRDAAVLFGDMGTDQTALAILANDGGVVAVYRVVIDSNGFLKVGAAL